MEGIYENAQLRLHHLMTLLLSRIYYAASETREVFKIEFKILSMENLRLLINIFRQTRL